jgi:type IX secretion system PorP/SprF family membrane protein
MKKNHNHIVSSLTYFSIKTKVKMGYIKLFTLIIFCSLAISNNSVKAQDMHFTQFFSNPLYLNPAFTGANVCSRVSSAYRNQWPGVTKTYRSYLLSVDHYIARYNIGIGVLFGSDVAGSGDLSTTIVNPMFAYELKINRQVSMRFGVQPGVGLKSLNFNALLFGDQIARGGNVTTLEVPTQSRTYFDIGTGAIIYSRKLWLGASAYHLTRPDVALMGNGDGILPIKYSLHGGLKHTFNPKERNLYAQRSISPAFNYRGQREFDQLDIGFYFTQYIVNIGVWYRGLPVLKAYQPGYANNDAIAIIIGLRTDRFNLGYSFDYTISDLTGLTHGAHELSLSYQLCKFKKRKKTRMQIPCPKF